MAVNTAPIYTRVGDIQGGAILLTAMTAATAYSGVDVNCIPVFTADATNGGYVQRIRFKPYGNTSNTSATVARIFINEGVLNQASPLSAVSGTPTGTPSTTGGTLQAGNYFAKIQAVDQWGGLTAASTESASVSVTGTTGSIAWAWNAVTGAVSYRIYVGPVTTGEYAYFTSNTNSYTQTAPYTVGQLGNPLDYVTNNMFYGEISLPSTTVSAAAALVEIDYPMNIALPPGYRIMVGLGTTVQSGWSATVIGGKY